MKDKPLEISDLPVFNGRVYHLDIGPEDLAPNIIIVGDPDRVPLIAEEFLRDIEVDRLHRGLRTMTGYDPESGTRVSVVTSGMGTPSLEIVLNEIVALNEVDFSTMTRKDTFDTLTVIRVGTTGGIQEDTEVGTLIISEYAVGLDNTGLFYDAAYQDESERALEERVREAIDGTISSGSRFKGKIFPYAAKAHPAVIEELVREAERLGVAYRRGITVSNSGFFANQGRPVARVQPTVPDIDILLAETDTGLEGLRMENMEMEASFLLHFMGALGHRAGVVCPVIDNRRQDRFLADYSEHIRNATRIALRALM